MSRPPERITDRAKRYRANRNRPNGPRQCAFCRSRTNVDVDHISGDETDGQPDNLIYLCRSCNVRKGITQARAGAGIRTRQYNPDAEKLTGNDRYGRYRTAALVLTGHIPAGAERIKAAASTVRQTPQELRQAYSALMNPFRSETQRRKFYALAESGKLPWPTVERWEKETKKKLPNPAPTFREYVEAAATLHRRGQHDAGGRVIHATPRGLRKKYAERIAAIKKGRRGTVPF